MQSPRPRTSQARRRLAGAALAILALAAFAWAFQWTWLRPAIQHYVMSHSGRTIAFDAMDVRFDGSLDPTVEFRNLEIENARWASRPDLPLVRARRVAATLAWRSLFEGQTIVRLFDFEGAQLDLERQADGLRNWRLGHPDDRGPPQLRVMAITVRDSTMRTVNGSDKAVADVAVSEIAVPRPVAGHDDLPLARRVVFSGTYEGHVFEGSADVSVPVMLTMTKRRFAFDGHGTVAGLRLDAHGVATDAHDLDDASFEARLSSVGPGDLWPLPLRATLGRLRPLVATAHVAKTGATWAATGLQATLGHGTTVEGELHVLDDRDSGKRRSVSALVSTARIDAADARVLWAPAPASAPRAAAAASAPASEQFALDKLRDVDADLELRDVRFAHSGRAVAQSLALKATLAQGLLKVQSLDLGTAGGHVTGTLQVDASKEVAQIALALQARGLRLEQLSEKLAASGNLEGRLDGRATLHAQGRSQAELARTAQGTVEASLAPGASVTRRLDAQLGLNGGEWLRTLFDRSERVPVQCAAVAFDIAKGRGASHRFVFETEKTALAGTVIVDLGSETLDATAMPIRKQRALIALDRSLHASGPWRAPKVALGPPIDGATPDKCPR